MRINGNEVVGKEFAYDGCHKMYIIENESDRATAFENGYEENDIMDISELERTYGDSCSLKFISNMKLDKMYVEQFEDAIFS